MFLDISQEELEKRKCTVNEQDTTALIFSQKHLEALYLQCLMHRRNAMQEIPELKGLSETCNRIYKLQDVDVLFQCLLMDQMDWEEEKLYVQFSTIYLLKQTDGKLKPMTSRQFVGEVERSQIPMKIYLPHLLVPP